MSGPNLTNATNSGAPYLDFEMWAFVRKHDRSHRSPNEQGIIAHATRRQPVYTTSSGQSPGHPPSGTQGPSTCSSPCLRNPRDSPLRASISSAASRSAPEPSCSLPSPPSPLSPRSSMPWSHNRSARFTSNSSGAARSADATSGATPDDDKDDPNQIDTIVLGDPADAPVPARKGNHVSPVHATILVRLPRYGDQVGLIPDTPAGHLLYNWLAAFNQASYPALGNALPNVALASAAASQMELRRQTGGFNLLSAKEVQPGVLVFRLRDQTPSATEVLGTLQVLPNSTPARIASFSLRAVPKPRQDPTTEPASPR